MTQPGNTLWVPAARLPEGWCESVLLEWNAAGTLTRVSPGSDARDHPQASGPAVPGVGNAHSHAFQRAMAGAAESTRGRTDTFWTWRNVMYQLAARLNPDQLEAIALSLYVEMLEAGFTSVCEFHYLHHDVTGQRYADPAEMSLSLLRAAERAGIAITLLPVLYQQGGFGGEPLTPQQQRFACTVEVYQQLLGRLIEKECPGVQLGLAMHSLRAVGPQAMAEMEVFAATAMPDAPIHIHISEQRAEVVAAMETLGTSPLHWLQDHADLDSRWCLIHATHATVEELRRVAKRKVTVCICPTTEGNLGDGIFELPAWVAMGGSLAVGTDSHVRVRLTEELSWLEYVQRLKLERRAVLSSADQPHTGASAWLRSAAGGASAAGRRAGVLAPGAAADFLVLDDTHPRLIGASADELLDRLVFAGSSDCIRDVYVMGRRRIENGHHPLRHEADALFREVMTELWN